ncbi:hypothetical protein D3C77_342420 [compost metagenome]
MINAVPLLFSGIHSDICISHNQIKVVSIIWIYTDSDTDGDVQYDVMNTDRFIQGIANRLGGLLYRCCVIVVIDKDELVPAEPEYPELISDKQGEAGGDLLQ